MPLCRTKPCVWQVILTIPFFLSQSISGQGETLVYIDLVSGYRDLSSCAEHPLSTIVRDMYKGCGDDSRLTSYTCFCTDSFSKFSFDISTEVLSQCGSGLAPQATRAVEVFTEYCSVGVTSGLPGFTDHCEHINITTPWYRC